jgi:hypothetical protein
MAYFCAECGSPIASSTAHCYSCGADHVPGIAETFLPYAAILVGLVLGIGGTFFGIRYWRSMNSGGNSIALTTPKIVSDGDNSDFGLGVGIYPGASPIIPATGSYVLRVKKGNSETARAEYATYDSVSRVADYYKNEMGPDAIIKPSLLWTTVTLARQSIVGTDKIVVTAYRATRDHHRDDNTRITVVHTKTAAS